MSGLESPIQGEGQRLYFVRMQGGGGAGRRSKAKGTSFGERVGVPRPTEPGFGRAARGRRPDEAGATPLVSFLTKGGAASWTFESDVFKAKTE